MSALGDYQLGQQVDTSTFTVTRRATRRGNERRFLLVTLKPETEAKRELLARFATYKRWLQQTDHACLPTLVDAFEVNNHPVLVLLDRGGHRLAEVLERSDKIPPNAALAIVIQLASAMGAIHDSGHAHGEVLARRVELTPSGGVCLHGFFASERTDGGQLAEPSHMAPEQILGDPADARSDVFALGMLLYRMIAGRRPFEGTHDTGIAQQIRHEQAPPISRYAEVPSALERVVQRAMQKRPQDRFPDMASFSGAAVAALRGQSTLSLQWWVAHALSDAGLGEAPNRPGDRGAGLGTGTPQQWLRRLSGPIAAGAALLALSIVVLRSCDQTAANNLLGPQGIAQQPARIRVLARPWAEVHVDGTLVAITPVASPVDVTPGKHTVVFKHPNAPDVTRQIDAIAGKIIVLDIEMQVTRPAGAPRRDAGTHKPSP